MNRKVILILISLWIIVIYISLIDFIIYSISTPYDLFGYDLGGTLEGGIYKAITSFLTNGTIIGISTILIFLNDYLTKEKLKIDPINRSALWIRVSILIILTFICLPWIFALNGIYISDIPGLNLIFIARQPGIGIYISEKERIYPSVHLGDHHGFGGYIFLIFVILLSFIVYKMKNKTIKYISIIGIGVLGAYGVIGIMEDFIREQILKRGIYLLIYDGIKFLHEYNIYFSISFGIIFFLINYYLLFRIKINKKSKMK
ncbi:MAG: hypothetical protein ACTSPY_06725 [Candidatus Helarchaeota archaeon]